MRVDYRCPFSCDFIGIPWMCQSICTLTHTATRNEECPNFLSSLWIDHRRRKTIPLWNSPGKKELLRASLYVCYLQYWALCDDLVDFKLWAGVRFLSFSIDTAPECILWKRSREDRSLRASRDGHSSSSSISPTLLVFRHLLQVQRAAVLWTFST